MQHPNWRSFWSAPVFSGAFCFESHLPSAIPSGGLSPTQSEPKIPKLWESFYHSTTPKNRLPQRGFTYQPRVATLRRLASLPWVKRPLTPPNPERVASSSQIQEPCSIRTGEAFGVLQSFLALFVSRAICHLPFRPAGSAPLNLNPKSRNSGNHSTTPPLQKIVYPNGVSHISPGSRRSAVLRRYPGSSVL